MNEVVIVEAIRTPIGAYKGSLKELSADKLGSIVIREILRKSKLGKNDIDEVIMGQVLTAGGGQNPARQAAINAGIDISKPAHIVNQVCGSGLRAVISGYQSIKLGSWARLRRCRSMTSCPSPKPLAISSTGLALARAPMCRSRMAVTTAAPSASSLMAVVTRAASLRALWWIRSNGWWIGVTTRSC